LRKALVKNVKLAKRLQKVRRNYGKSLWRKSKVMNTPGWVNLNVTPEMRKELRVIDGQIRYHSVQLNRLGNEFAKNAELIKEWSKM
jgi:hypothetical protein